MLGGIGNIYGAMIGGILLGLIESLGAGYIGDLTGGFLGSNYQDIFAFIVLIIVLTLRPSGHHGRARRRPRLTSRDITHGSPQLRQRPPAGRPRQHWYCSPWPCSSFPSSRRNFGNSWVRIIDIALLYIMLALGLNIVVGFAGLLDLGYIAFFARRRLPDRPAGVAAVRRAAGIAGQPVPALGEALIALFGPEIAQQRHPPVASG